MSILLDDILRINMLWHAVPLILVQKFSWWQYHFLLFLFPIGFLAVVGFDRLLSLLGERRRWMSGAILFLLTALPLATLMQGVNTRATGLARVLPESTDMSLPIRHDGAYRKYWQETGFLRARVPEQGTIYVFGCLVLPALSARATCREMRSMFWVAPAIALATTVPAFVLAHALDLPPAQLAVAIMAGALVVAWGMRWMRPAAARA